MQKIRFPELIKAVQDGANALEMDPPTADGAVVLAHDPAL
jgi:glycerophosphoryl diester phosphodiesterase